MTYVDEEAGVLQGGLLADLLHDFGLCVEGHFDGVCVVGFWWWGGVGFGVVVGGCDGKGIDVALNCDVQSIKWRRFKCRESRSFGLSRESERGRSLTRLSR